MNGCFREGIYVLTNKVLLLQSELNGILKMNWPVGVHTELGIDLIFNKRIECNL